MGNRGFAAIGISFAFCACHALAQSAVPSNRLGMDPATFKHHFGAAIRPVPRGALPAKTHSDLAERVAEVRLFLTDRPNIVVGEVEIGGNSTVKELPLSLERGVVLFLDSGRPPDKRAGDGIFTAEFPMDTRAALQALQRDAQAVVEASRAPGKRFIRRGPRDLVLLGSAAELGRAATDPATARALQAPDPREVARQLAVDPARVPFFTLPGPGWEPRKFWPPKFFGIPIPPVFPAPPPPQPIVIESEKSLMVVHTGVVEDGGRTFDPCTGAVDPVTNVPVGTGTAGGAWTFGHLMREMANGTGLSPEDFAMHWLSSWITAQEANGFIVDEPDRGAAMQSRIVSSWQRLSGGTLKVDRFPARLLAIINRPDLADKIGYTAAGTAGEGRFIFGLLELPSGATACNTLPFTVIFEYGIKGGSCMAVKSWHQKWKDLDQFQAGSSQYNVELEKITRAFTDHGSNPVQAPNQSALNQLRTNENALNPLWQLREFRLEDGGLLDLVTVKQTPDDAFRNGTTGTAAVAQFINDNEGAILQGAHVVPDRFPGILDRFRGARSNVPFSPDNVFWNAPSLNSMEARRIFSLNTCNACHGGETKTFFTHVGALGNRAPGAAAALSGFLTGIDLATPVSGEPRHYDDLAERKLKMEEILSNPCFRLIAFRRIPFVH